MLNKVYIYSDGGARGNPGPAAIGIILLDEAKNIITKKNDYLGVSTNNRAEYTGVIRGLELASQYTNNEVVFTIDSELVVKQLTGRYKVRDKLLKLMYKKVKSLITKFKKVSFRHEPRTNDYISIADELVNENLDKH